MEVGDSNFKKKCLESFQRLLDTKKTILIISHDLEFIKKHADRILVLTPEKHYLINDRKQLENINDLAELLSFCDTTDVVA
jgi:ABC-type polysaccharide/polyol phosphate transport system ATPase subunit